MAIKDSQNHVESALGRMPGQFIDSSNFRNIVTIGADRVQGLNDEAIKILDGRSLTLSSGKQLDNLATILNVTRSPGEPDSDFRVRVLSETSALARSGEPRHVIDVYLLLTEAISIFYTEIYPAGFQMAAHVAVDPEDPDTDALILESMGKTKAGGVDMILVIAPDTDYFMLDSAANVDGSDNGPISAEYGLGSSTDVDGGQVSRVLS